MAAMDPAEAVMRAAAAAIAKYAGEAASREEPWDGYGGLVRICDDDTLREQGVVRAVSRPAAPPPPPPAASPSPKPAAPAAAQPAASSQPAAAAHAAAAESVGAMSVPTGLPIAGATGGTGPPWLGYGTGGGLSGGAQWGAPPGLPGHIPAPGQPQAGPRVVGPASAVACAKPSSSDAPGGPQPAAAGLRRVPSWVQEYVLGSEGGPGGSGGASGGSGDSPSGGAGGGSGTAGGGAGQAAPSGRPGAAALALVGDASLTDSLRQLQPEQQRQPQQARRPAGASSVAVKAAIYRHVRKAAGVEPDLSWVDELPTPPKNPVVRKHK